MSGAGEMELICYLHPGWAPLIRPAPATRAWMDATPESFAYRCLPLNIANAHGWEILSPCGFEAVWNGGPEPDGGHRSRLDAGADPERAPVSLFGQGILTFHIEGIFRTPPGWNLWVGGSPNRQKDAHRAADRRHRDRLVALHLHHELALHPAGPTRSASRRWSRSASSSRCSGRRSRRSSRSSQPLDGDPETAGALPGLERRRATPSTSGCATTRRRRRADRWQKHYYRGVDVAGEALIDDHRAKLRLQALRSPHAPGVPPAPLDDAAAGAGRAGRRRRRARRASAAGAAPSASGCSRRIERQRDAGAGGGGHRAARRPERARNSSSATTRPTGR